MAVTLRSTVYGVVLGRRDSAEVLGVIALDAFDKCGSKAGGEERVFPIGFLTAPPARVPEDIDVRGPDSEAVINGVNVVTHSLVVFGAGLDGDDLADVAEERLVKCRGHADSLREESSVAGSGDAMKALTPVIVCRDAKAGDGGGGIDHLRSLLVEGHSGDEVLGALFHGERRVLIGQHAIGLCAAGDVGQRDEKKCEGGTTKRQKRRVHSRPHIFVLSKFIRRGSFRVPGRDKKSDLSFHFASKVYAFPNRSGFGLAPLSGYLCCLMA